MQPAWDLAGEADRAGYVGYQGSIPAYRIAAQNMTRSLKFGNGSVGASYLDKFANFANEGHAILGGDKAYATRHAWEAVLQLLEYLRCCNMELTLPIAELLSHIQYINPSTGEVVPVAPLPFDPALEGHKDCVKLRHWAWYKQRCEVYSVKIRRAKVKEVQRSNVHHFRTPEEEQIEELRRHLASGARVDKGATYKRAVEADNEDDEGQDYSEMDVSKITNLKEINGKVYFICLVKTYRHGHLFRSSSRLFSRVRLNRSWLRRQGMWLASHQITISYLGKRLQGNSDCVARMHQLAPPSLRSLLPCLVVEGERTSLVRPGQDVTANVFASEAPEQPPRQSKRLLEDSSDDEGLVEFSRQSKKLVVESDSEELLAEEILLDTTTTAARSTQRPKRRLEDISAKDAVTHSRQSTPNSEGEPEVEPPRKRRKERSVHQTEPESESEEEVQDGEYVVEKVLGERKRTVGKGKNKKQVFFRLFTCVVGSNIRHCRSASLSSNSRGTKFRNGLRC